MAATTLDPRTALIVIDLQNGIVVLPAVHPVPEVVGRASALARAFRRHGLPVVLVNVDGGAPGRSEQAARIRDVPAGWAELVPALGAAVVGLRHLAKRGRLGAGGARSA